MKSLRAIPLLAFLLLSGLVAMSSQAVGQETNTSADGDVPVLKLSWDAPTTRVNGSPLAADKIVSYRLRCQNQTMDAGTDYEILTPVDTQNYEVAKDALFPEYGTYDCTVSVVATGDYEGTKSSVASNAVSASWNSPATAEPVAPANFQILTQ
jgi:hypothetical protein